MCCTKQRLTQFLVDNLMRDNLEPRNNLNSYMATNVQKLIWQSRKVLLRWK